MHNRGRRTRLIPPGTQLLSSVGDLHNEVQQYVLQQQPQQQQQQQAQQRQQQPQPQQQPQQRQQQLVYLKRVGSDPHGYVNDYYFTMKKSDWDLYRHLDHDKVITSPIYYNGDRYTNQTFKRGDLAMETDSRMIQNYKKTGRIPLKGFFLGL